ncbi:MAG: phage portal protein [Synergistaceae bacterium]|jgi:lambda family phage portal protein|nr:phage portal protein [Synergistaceae bacterium]
MRESLGKSLRRVGESVAGGAGRKPMNSGYSHHGANVTKKGLIGWDSTSFGADEDIDRNIVLLRQRSRDLYMGGALVAAGALKTTRTNVIGAGLTVKPSIAGSILGISSDEADVWQQKAQDEFGLWGESKDCDAARRNNFAELQQLAFLEWLLDGDVFAALPYIPRPGNPYDVRVLLIEADRVCDPARKDPSKDICQGVETGRNGEVTAYYICNQHPVYSGFYSKPKKWKRVAAFGAKTGRPNILHIMESERAGQSRGIPMLAPIIEAAKHLGQYTEAELIAALVAGMFTVFISTETPDVPMGESAIPLDEQIDAGDESSIELGNGAVVGLRPNEKATIANPGRPYAGFESFVTSMCRQVGAALEIPYEILLKQFTASYSASRAALLEAWKMFKMRRSWFVSDFCQPIYEEVITEAVAKGRLDAPGFWSAPEIRKAWLKAEWYGPTQGQIDPLKEVNAAVTRVENGFSTRARETSELTGGDFEMNVRQLAHEETLMREAGLKKEGGKEGDAKQILDDPDEKDDE